MLQAWRSWHQFPKRPKSKGRRKKEGNKEIKTQNGRSRERKEGKKETKKEGNKSKNSHHWKQKYKFPSVEVKVKNSHQLEIERKGKERKR
jgi:hypothetical protein